MYSMLIADKDSPSGLTQQDRDERCSFLFKKKLYCDGAKQDNCVVIFRGVCLKMASSPFSIYLCFSMS